MPLVSTCLIERNIFFREGVKSLLTGTDYHINQIYPDGMTAQKESSCKSDVKLALIGTESRAETIKAQVGLVKNIYPECRVVILTAQAEPKCIMSAFASGADGYLLRDITPQALVGSLGMVVAGEKVYPAAALDLLVKQTPAIGAENIDSKFSAYHLSCREVQVLKYLAVGETNKQIARDLDITEATVKVHIKGVLRKLDLSNRTQAAIWAVNKGLTEQGNENLRMNPAA